VPRGLNVRASGEDFPVGQLLLPVGHQLRPADLAAAAVIFELFAVPYSPRSKAGSPRIVCGSVRN
jgi:molybdopterin biosynthesis enzyme